MNVASAIEILKDKGYKYTGKREEMLELFSKEKRYLTPKEVIEVMKNDHPGISFDTIYRNLALFSELDILESTELNGEKRFRFSCSTNDHHHHFICLDCGKTQEIKNCPMDAVETNSDGFTVTGHKFEVYGYCSECHDQPNV
ncbi:Fur family zinc uptake regulator [Scopulibacillus darangshiensis]|uniref:Fur family zinc uptake regulator n=1 Tax=Scopulibacillus darangshiensis TaxID=442528 RepID=A0A4R2P7C3_9BACL|nr:Fur family transcriptional regulator [Scopulibacillus darangshiensis]TCP29715.1 Fur family zinc uptake regulator [Scopulibacillus darangshiensis]